MTPHLDLDLIELGQLGTMLAGANVHLDGTGVDPASGMGIGDLLHQDAPNLLHARDLQEPHGFLAHRNGEAQSLGDVADNLLGVQMEARGDLLNGLAITTALKALAR